MDRSLAQRDEADESIRLHDLQLDYCVPVPGPGGAGVDPRRPSALGAMIDRDADQFASQMVGRLLSYRDMPAIHEFTERVAEGRNKPWLRPLQPALVLREQP